MNDELYLTQVQLEEEMRTRSISKFLKDHENELTNTITGSFLMTNYILPLTQGISEFLEEAGSGKVGRRSGVAKGLSELPPEVSAYLFIKCLLNRIPLYSRENTRLSVTSLAVQAGGLLHDELRIRKFEANNVALLGKIEEDFNNRELPRYKRKEYMQKVIADADEDWTHWSKNDLTRIGLKLIELFMHITGDIRIEAVKAGKHSIDIVVPSDGLLTSVERVRELKEDLTAVWYPMIHLPVPWSSETLSRGGYLSHHVTPYPLVKSSKREYRELLREKAEVGGLDITLDAINAIQATPWRINKRVLDVIDYVFSNNIECGSLPRADHLEPDPAPEGVLELPRDDKRRIEYMRYRATVHEQNRRSVGKRVLVLRALHMAERFADYERIYFPHDLDSRGRAYPKPYPLNPQGPDYVKGLLEFADGKALGRDGLYWLGVHGANCFGEDKIQISERAAWAEAHLEEIKAVAANPKGNLWWTRADSPVQFLAFCFEYAEAQSDPRGYVSHLHVDLDATCSGLQHFSAMLRDEIGGQYVNMTPNDQRQDVYGAVAQEAVKIFQADATSGSDTSALAQAWLDSGLMDRKVAKRPVMVKPYSGTLTSCLHYVRDAVDDKLHEGALRPWSKDDMYNFKLYGGKAVWAAIPKIVVAADKAMHWISAIARAVGKSSHEKNRIEWETPVGFPVWLYKYKMKSRRVVTFFDGRRYLPSLSEPTKQLDPRQMASATPPSFVHSMDGAHLQLTVAMATDNGIHHFAMVHDSFGVHAADVSLFSKIIREAFIELYSYDVLDDFYEGAKPLISEEYLKGIPPKPDKGSLNLSGIRENEFFFS